MRLTIGMQRQPRECCRKLLTSPSGSDSGTWTHILPNSLLSVVRRWREALASGRGCCHAVEEAILQAQGQGAEKTVRVHHEGIMKRPAY